MNKLKKFVKDNKVTIIVVGAGLLTIMYQAYRISSLKKDLYRCQGEKNNLEFMIEGLKKTVGNLIYQTGKLNARRGGKE